MSTTQPISKPLATTYAGGPVPYMAPIPVSEGAPLLRAAYSRLSAHPRNPASAVAYRDFVSSFIAMGMVFAGPSANPANRVPPAYSIGLREMGLYWGTSDLLDAVDLLRSDAPQLPRREPKTWEEEKFISFTEPGIVFPDGSTVRAMWLCAGIGMDGPLPYDLCFTFEDDGEIGNINQFRIGYYTSSAELSGDAAKSYEVARLVDWIIDNPDLVEKKPRDLRSKAARRRGKHHKPSTVTIVDLRAAHREAAADVARAEGTYRSRWIVRRHWHNYWVGSGEDRRLEPRYVMPYVKGPAGAPPNVTERVKKW